MEFGSKVFCWNSTLLWKISFSSPWRSSVSEPWTLKSCGRSSQLRAKRTLNQEKLPQLRRGDLPTSSFQCKLLLWFEIRVLISNQFRSSRYGRLQMKDQAPMEAETWVIFQETSSLNWSTCCLALYRTTYSINHSWNQKTTYSDCFEKAVSNYSRLLWNVIEWVWSNDNVGIKEIVNTQLQKRNTASR
jgi:hypothetical protein